MTAITLASLVCLLLVQLPDLEAGNDTTEANAHPKSSGSHWIWIGVGILLIMLAAVAAVVIIILIWRAKERKAQEANKVPDKTVLIADIVDLLVEVDSDPGMAGAVLKTTAPDAPPSAAVAGKQ